MFHRERAAGMYAALPYALAQGDVEVPYIIVQTARPASWAPLSLLASRAS